MVQRSAVLLILVAPAWRPLTTALHRHARLPRVAKRDDAARRDPAGGAATRGCVRSVEVAKARCGDVRAVVRSGTIRSHRWVSRKCRSGALDIAARNPAADIVRRAAERPKRDAR